MKNLRKGVIKLADKETRTNTLVVGVQNTNAEAYDESNTAKTQYIRLPNPKTNLTEEQIKNAVQTGLTDEIWLDNKDVVYATDSKITTAYTEHQSILAVDIGVE